MTKKILLGVCSSIAIYKSIDLLRELKSRGYNVYVIMTKSATKFIKPTIFGSISGNEVICDLFKREASLTYPHISLTDAADLLVIAPATANIIGKIANGIADDALSTIAMSVKSSVLIAPAMNERMWLNPVVQENVEKLKKIGYSFIGPGYGELACGLEGWGKLASIADIVSKIEEILKVT